MEKKKYVVNDIFEIADYIGLVNAIASKFFSGGEYQPSYGKINAMRMFFNICVKESPFNFVSDVETDIEMNEVLKDEEFLAVFGESLNNDTPYKLTFGNAYRDAIDIVEAKKSGIGQVAETIKSLLSDLLDNIENLLNPETLSKLEKISEDVSSGNLSAESIAKAFGNKVFK